jgi:hypothetical protein
VRGNLGLGVVVASIPVVGGENDGVNLGVHFGGGDCFDEIGEVTVSSWEVQVLVYGREVQLMWMNPRKLEINPVLDR